MPVAGGAPELVLEDRGSAEVSPDGTSMVYPRLVGWLDGNCGSTFSEMWISDADGSDDHVLVLAAADERRGAWASGWSPDGSRIAYSESLVPPNGCSFPDPILGMYVMDMETGDRTLIAFGYSIDWQDDHTVLVRAWRGQGS
jgi:hypothetical protein